MNQLYPLGKQSILSGLVNWPGGDMRVVLVDATYVPNFATDRWLSHIPAGARVATSGPLAGKTAALGVADAQDAVINTTAPTDTVVALVVYGHTGVEATSPLIVWWDTAVGLVVDPEGRSVTVQWDNGPSRIFSL